MSNIKKNYLYNVMYQVLLIIIPLITTPYLSRILGADGIGMYSFSNSIAYYFVMFTMLGLNNYGNRTIAAISFDKKGCSKAFWSIYYMQLMFAITMISLYCVYIMIFSTGKLISLTFLPYVLSGALDINWFYFGIEKFRLPVIRNMVIKVCSIICIFIFVKSSNDIIYYCLIMSLGNFMSQLALWPFLKKYVSFEKIDFVEIAKHIKPNLILFIPVISISLYKIMDKVMLGYMSVISEVGFYENAEKIASLPSSFICALGSVMLPRISNLLAKKQEDKIKQYFIRSIFFAGILSAVVCFGIIGVGNEFVPLFYGNGYEKCIELFWILLPSGIFVALANVVRTQYLIPFGKDRIYIKSVIYGAISNVIINFICIPIYGSIGAAIGTLAAEFVVCIYQCIQIKEYVQIFKYVFGVIPFIVFGFFMAGVLSGFSLNGGILYNLIFKVLLGMLIYIVLSVIYFFGFLKNKIDKWG